MKKISILILIFISWATIQFYAQNIDSLKIAFKSAKNDTTRCNLLGAMVEAEMDDQLWPKYNDQLLKLCKIKIKNKSTPINFYKKYLADAYNNKGYLANVNGDFQTAIFYFERCLALYSQVNNISGIANILNNLGYIANQRGDIKVALEKYHLSLKYREKINDLEGIAESMNNIGVVYYKQNQNKKALEYYLKALKYRKRAKDIVGISYSLSNIGTVFEANGQINNALTYFKKSLEIRIKNDDKNGIATCNNNIASIYVKKKEFDKAIAYYSNSLNIYTQTQNRQGITLVLNNLADTYFILNQINQAYEFALKSFKISNELGYPENIKDASSTLSKIYEKQGKENEALEMYKLYIIMRDSINNRETQNESIKKQFQYNYDKKAAADSVAYAKEKEIQNTKLKVKRNQQNALFIGLGLVMIFAFFIYKRYRISQKQKEIIEIAHVELEHKNNEILDSITYAKRIQSAILPQPKLVKEFLEDSFILYKPKDIVAGDFYWLEVVGDTVLFAAADCTGHGVPGAMVSVVCNNGLNRAVREFGLTKPNEILDKTRELVIQEFEKSDEDVKDGMDISICALNIKTNNLKWAGANNPLWILRNDKIIENKPDKQPIGKHFNSKPFSLVEIQLEKDDIIYIFTDGFQDQFGGPNEKKYRVAQMRELFSSLISKTMEEQRKIIDASFETWKGELEQVDDVCVIGVRV